MKRYGVLVLLVAAALTVPFAFAGTSASDARLQAELQDKIFHAHVFKHGQVAVAYENGTATLTGTVDNLGTKMDAERAARKVDGVQRVVNNIVVYAEDLSPAQMLAQARKEVITYYAYGIFDNIQLAADGGRLVVSGEVTQPFKKSDLGAILSRVRGVAVLDNNLKVLPLSNFDDALRIRVARAIYGNDVLLTYGYHAVPPIHIIVDNGNVTLEGVVGSKLDRQIAEVAARNAGLSFSVVNNLRVDHA